MSYSSEVLADTPEAYWRLDESSGTTMVDSSGRRIRVSRKAILDAREADEVREYAERADAAPSEGFGSLAEKLRGALKPREK